MIPCQMYSIRNFESLTIFIQLDIVKITLYNHHVSLSEKCPNTEFFSGPYFPEKDIPEKNHTANKSEKSYIWSSVQRKNQRIFSCFRKWNPIFLTNFQLLKIKDLIQFLSTFLINKLLSVKKLCGDKSVGIFRTPCNDSVDVTNFYYLQYFHSSVRWCTLYI